MPARFMAGMVGMVTGVEYLAGIRAWHALRDAKSWKIQLSVVRVPEVVVHLRGLPGHLVVTVAKSSMAQMPLQMAVTGALAAVPWVGVYTAVQQAKR